MIADAATVAVYGGALVLIACTVGGLSEMLLARRPDPVWDDEPAEQSVFVAESVQFVGDERGWEMHVETWGGETFVFDVHGLSWELAGHCQETLGWWRREGVRTTLYDQEGVA